MSEIKPGDRVWIPATIHAEHAGRTQPIFEVLALGDVPADWVLPDHPALPAIARWLADYPTGDSALESAIRCWLMSPGRPTPITDTALEGLLAALATDRSPASNEKT